jgi:hypothetical protein
MLYGKKPNLRNLHEWGNQVWAHTLEGMKLDGQSKVGKWIGYDEISNGHRIYWPDKRSVTVERSNKFNNDDVLFPSIPVVQLIQGEKAQEESMNLQNDSKNEKENHEKQKLTEYYQKDIEDPVEDQTKTRTPTPLDQWQQVPFNQVMEKSVAT